MTAGCSVQPKLNKHTKKRKKDSGAKLQQQGCSPCLVNNILTSCVVLLALRGTVEASCAVGWISCSGLVQMGFASG